MMFVVNPVKKNDVKKVLEKTGGLVKDIQFTNSGTLSWRV